MKFGVDGAFMKAILKTAILTLLILTNSIHTIMQHHNYSTTARHSILFHNASNLGKPFVCDQWRLTDLHLLLTSDWLEDVERAKAKIDSWKAPKAIEIVDYYDIEQLLDEIHEIFGSNNIVQLVISKTTISNSDMTEIKKFDFRKFPYLRSLELGTAALAPEIFNAFVYDKEYPRLEKLTCYLRNETLSEIKLNPSSKGFRKRLQTHYFGIDILRIEYQPISPLVVMAGCSFSHNGLGLPAADMIPCDCRDLLTALQK